MCGIVGYIGTRQASPIILAGLKQLEYRGYDSAGLAVLQENGAIALRREAGKLQNLVDLVQNEPAIGQIGMGHTRWATHGQPNRTNSHPHRSMKGRIVVVHNGIVENFLSLKGQLQAEGVQFESQTDTEVIAQWMEKELDSGKSFIEAARATLQKLEGSSAVVILSPEQPDRLVTARLGNAGGITLGIGEGEMFVASDIPAILEHTRRMIFLENRQMAEVSADSFILTNLNGEKMPMVEHYIPYDPVSAAKGEFKHFMQKEIFEQPRAIVDTLRGRVNFETGEITLPEMKLSAELLAPIRKLFITACGTSYYSGLVGKFLLEAIARIPVEVEYASEFRYYNPIVDPNSAVLAITQSGETADTLAAFEQAREKGALLWSIVNAIGSQAMRVADGHIAMHCGPEIGVASTKAFTTSVVDQYLLAVALGRWRGVISAETQRDLVADLARLPALTGELLESCAKPIELLAQQFHKAQNFLYLGRGINYPVALEGALKLKEISYIHAEGYPAGEMKHGPIALIDEKMPVLAIATQDALYDKMISQIQQAKARGGKVIAIATAGDKVIAQEADEVVYVPETPYYLSPVVNVIPLQLLAYAIAVRRGADVDQPRNLAKSVTVE